MKNILLGAFLFLSLCCFAQSDYPTSNSTHIFWQPGVKITKADYQGASDPHVDSLMQKYGFWASASVGIWSVLDVPKKEKDRYKKFEKVYFAPAFEKATSYAASDDSVQIEMQNLYLDIYEVCTRWARKELKNMHDSINATGMLTLYYMTVKDAMEDKKRDFCRAYFNDVFMSKKEGAFNEWRSRIDKLLEETVEYATTAEECYRLMTDKPIEKGYIKAPAVAASRYKRIE